MIAVTLTFKQWWNVAITNELFLKVLIQKEDIEWHRHPNGGFVSISNGVSLYLNGGGHANFGYLNISNGFKRYVINEPREHIFKTPSEAKVLLGELVSIEVNQCNKRDTDEYAQKTEQNSRK